MHGTMNIKFSDKRALRFGGNAVR